MDRIAELRRLMKENKIDVYYVPTDDYHGSEFVGEFFKVREFLSGFTGSAGTLIVTMTEAGLWTDGRYFLQAEEELKNSEITLYKAGIEGTITINQFLLNNLDDNKVMGFNGKCLAASSIISLKKLFKNNGKNLNIKEDVELEKMMWKDRPPLPNSQAFILEDKFSGETADSKIRRLRKVLKEKKMYGHIITSLDDIAWLLNIRANDIKCSPLLLSYMIVTETKLILYCSEISVVGIMEYLIGLSIKVKEYEEIYNDISEFSECANGNMIMADLDSVNYLIYNKMCNCRIFNMSNPTSAMKAIKNNVEIVNEAEAHIKDAVAYVKFLYWFNNNLNKGITEMDVAKKLLEERSKMEGFIEESFEPIVAYGKHGAIVHYSPTDESNIVISNTSFVLIDTGAHYLEGTTDITRTLSCGALNDSEKKSFTLVLKGNLALGDAKFLYGITGVNLDILARSALWKEGFDYNHGTGHGVGYLLNVHEGPNNIRWRLGSARKTNSVIEPGMITSNEPGLYITDEYGIRLENMIVCKEKNKNEYGRFMEFETLTLVPFDLKSIDLSLLNEHEKELLNNYHKKIYNILHIYLEKEEADYLKSITQPV